MRFTMMTGLLVLSAACSEDSSTPLSSFGPDVGRPSLPDAASEQATVYYVVRHTERDPGYDPPINAVGEARALDLANALETQGIEDIVATFFIRGQQSGQPLAERLGLDITVAPAAFTNWPAFADEVAAWQMAREESGKTYLMIGHAGGYNSTLLRGLGATFDGTLAETYGDLVTMIREEDGSVRLTSTTF